MSTSDPEVTSFDRKSPESGCRRPKTGIYCAFDFLQGYSLQEAATWQKMTSRDHRWADVTRKWRQLTGSHLEVAVEGRKLAYALCLTVARWRRQSRDRKWRHVTSGDPKWCHLTRSRLEVAVEGRKLAYTVHLTSYKAVACRRRQSRDRKTSRDLRWPEVTRKWRLLSWSHLEEAIGWKLAMMCVWLPTRL